jgi:hypothetical protein
MRRKLILSAIMLLMIAGFSSCEKDSKEASPSRKYMLGRWQVTKVDVNSYSSSGTLLQTNTINYTNTDFIDFKDNDDDEVDVKLGTNQSNGTYVILDGGKFNISLPSKLLYCTTTSISETSFQFTGTADQSGIKTTETYYLTR